MTAPRTEPSARRWPLAIAAVAVAGLLSAVAADLVRGGYSPDEEYTLFAVRGIEASGLPLLPSGLLYDRGLGYSYAAWLAGLITGNPLTGGRLVSIVCAGLALAAIARGLRRLATPAVAAAGVAVAATSLPFWVSATTARFYAPFLLGYLVCLTLMAERSPSWARLAVLAVAAGCTRWTHELAFTLAAVPFIALVVAPADRRTTWFRVLGATILGLVASQFAIFAVHAAAPPTNGDVMVKRFFLWQVLNLFERPPFDLAATLPLAAAAGGATALALALVRWRQDAASGLMLLVGGLAAALGQLGVGPFAALLLQPVVPPAWRRPLVGRSLAVLAGGSLFWMLALVAAGLGPGEALARIGASGAAYPLDMFSYLVRESPVLMTVALAGLLARSAGRGGPWTAHERALHALWLGWVAWFGVIESGITSRYLLLPVTFLLCATAVDGAAILRSMPSDRRRLATAGAAILALLVVAESWVGPGWQERRWRLARPTLVTAAAASELQSDDLVVSHDELGAVIVAGRLDAWLVLDPFFEERFVVRRDGQPFGTYTGAPAAPELTPLVERAEREHRRLIVIDVLRDVPGFGPTDGLLPRQLAREQLRGEVIAETPGLRIVHVPPPPSRATARLTSTAPSRATARLRPTAPSSAAALRLVPVLDSLPSGH